MLLRDLLFAVVVASASTSALGACASRSAAAADACALSFDGTIEGGPSFGARIEGEVFLDRAADQTLSGVLIRPDRIGVSVTATLSADTLTISIPQAAGGTALATAPLGSASFDACHGDLAGTIAGPKPLDVGSFKGTFSTHKVPCCSNRVGPCATDCVE
jgi:hypothetical protein